MHVVAGMRWVFVAAGVCRFGDDARPIPVPDLWWSATPVTRRQANHLAGSPDVPLTGVTWSEAAAVADSFHARLPRSVEWEWMAAGPARRRYPWGDQDWQPHRALLRPSDAHGPAPVGSHPVGRTPEGLDDVAGNVWEWTSSPVMGNGYVIRGGSYASPPLYARTTFLNAAPAELASRGIGFRLVREDAP
jgi:iron(II)-dependent oxidoreductase